MVEPGSTLHGDDVAAKGYGPSILARQFLTTAADHDHALRTLVNSGQFGNAAPWALMRCVIETTSQAAYMLGPESRADRVLHALSSSYYGYDMERKYAVEIGAPISDRARPYLLQLGSAN